MAPKSVVLSEQHIIDIRAFAFFVETVVHMRGHEMFQGTDEEKKLMARYYLEGAGRLRELIK